MDGLSGNGGKREEKKNVRGRRKRGEGRMKGKEGKKEREKNDMSISLQNYIDLNTQTTCFRLLVE